MGYARRSRREKSLCSRSKASCTAPVRSGSFAVVGEKYWRRNHNATFTRATRRGPSTRGPITAVFQNASVFQYFELKRETRLREIKQVSEITNAPLSNRISSDSNDETRAPLAEQGHLATERRPVSRLTSRGEVSIFFDMSTCNMILLLFLV